MNIVRADQSKLDALASLALKLWPDNTHEQLLFEFEKLLLSNKDTVYVATVEGKDIGFVHMSLREDYVEGSDSSPVGYVEGIYVEQPYRKQGISRMLLEYGAKWARSHGCTQLASDAELENVASQQFHQSIGFREANRIVAFIMDI